MTIAVLFDRRLEIRRAALHSPAAVDDWNQPTYDADAVAATLDGAVQPLSVREVALLTDAGAQLGDYQAFVDAVYVKTDGTQAATDVRMGDRVRDITAGSGNPTFEVRSVIDAAGRGHHFELVLRRVVD